MTKITANTANEPVTKIPVTASVRRSSLNDVDTFVIHKDLALPGSNEELERCEGWVGIQPALDLEEQRRWQTVVNGIPETYVFSAYYDGRTKPAAVKIIGISSGFQGSLSGSPLKFCQLWYVDETIPRVTVAEYTIVPETHDMKYAASFHICHLSTKVHSVPYAVSLVKDKCQTAANVLKVIDNHMDERPSVNFTVCVTPFNFNYDNYRRLVEFIETNRMFGAGRFIFYNYTTGSKIMSYLRHYVHQRIADIIQWHVPVTVNVWPPDPKEEPEIHYFAQLASLNDCLYRAMFRSRFVVFSDLDELVVPRRHDTWLSMLDDVTTKWQEQVSAGSGVQRVVLPGSYLIRNVFFPTNWPNDERANMSWLVHDLDLLTLLKTQRESYIHLWYLRSKYFVWSRLTSMVSVHCALEFIDDLHITTVQVADTDALLHHYRVWEDSVDREDDSPISDQHMHKYYNQIVERTSAVHDAVRHWS
jgi:hypothetical protein